MSTRMVTRSVNPLIFLAAATALAVSTSFSCALFFKFQTINEQKKVYIDFARVLWWNNLRFRLNQAAERVEIRPVPEIRLHVSHSEIKLKAKPEIKLKAKLKTKPELKLEAKDDTQVERGKLLTIYRNLHQHLLLAVDTQPIRQMNTQIVATITPRVDLPKQRTGFKEPTKEPKEPQKRAKQVANTNQTPPQSQALSVNLLTDTIQALPLGASRQQTEAVQKERVRERISTLSTQPVSTHLAVNPPAQILKQIEDQAERGSQVRLERKGEYSKPKVSIVSQTLPHLPPATPPVSPPPAEKDTHALTPSQEVADNKDHNGKMNVFDFSQEEAVPCSVSERAGSFRQEGIEGFSADTKTFPVKSEIFSQEGTSCGDQEKWISTSLGGYWSTLSWQTKKGQVAPIPLISNNTALLLARLGGGPPQPGAGIVFGIVPAGWLLELSERADSPIYLDDDRKPVPSGQFLGERQFVFLNVAPGSHLLFMRGPSGAFGPAIALPVIGGAATRLTLMPPERSAISGRILDAGVVSAKGLSGVRVHVVGQSDAATSTDLRGAFKLEGVFTLSHHPIFIETEAQGGFAHRHRIEWPFNRSFSLFRFKAKQLQGWLDQLEGGVSPESGLVLGALPAVTNEVGFPSLRPLGTIGTLQPETYTILEDDRLAAHRSLVFEAPRFVSVQVPEGVNLGQVEDQEGQTLWSQLLYSSPGVINVIGP